LKLSVEFVPYILEQRTREIVEFLREQGKIDTKLQLAMLHEVIEVITTYTSPNTEVTWLATMSYRKIKQLMKEEDPYKELKRTELSYARGILDKIFKGDFKGLKEDEKIDFMLKTSISADIINMLYKDTTLTFEKEVDKIQEIQINGVSSNELLNEINGKRVAFIPNNIGEFVFDLEFLKLLVKNYDVRVKVYLKTGTYANDITYNDAVNNFDFPDEIRVMPIDTDAAGFDKSLLSKSDFEDILSNEVIVAKGIMNYCGLHNLESDTDKIVFLKIKSYPISLRLGLPLNAMVGVRV